MAAEAAISTVSELLGELFQKVKFLRGVEGNVELLKDELRRMQSFLRDANKKQYEDHRVRNLISDIRELAQDAEDTIEMFLINVENSRNISLFNKCANFTKRVRHLDTIGEEIESIRRKLVDINKSRDTYGIKDLGEAEEAAWRLQVESQRRLSPWQTDEHLVGIQDDVKKVLRESILEEEKKGLSIAVLEGIGGIGKSTLAREIYNHRDVIVPGRFDHRAWVVVSSEFTPEETIKQLIFQLPRSEEEKKKLQELEETTKDKLYLLAKFKEILYNQLEDKSYFIVLDDVWKKEHLESLITDFPNQQGKASRLLVTTRNKDVATYDQYIHKMKLLDSKKGWELLLKKVFIGSSDGKCPEILKSIGRQILEKCHGLPLAINVIGGLLGETQTKSGWEEVLKHINSYLGRAESSVSSILELSYQNLSPQLKSCFLCLSFFKEDFTIPAKRLVNIWNAQGLIQKEGNKSIDEMGRGYLNELINRSMVQIQDLTVDGRVKNCRIHDLLREVCLRKAEEEIGLQIVKQGGEGTSSQSSYKARHRVLYGKNLETCSSNQNKHLRSLFLLNIQGDRDIFVTIPSGYWKGYQLLKTLELDGFTFLRFSNSFRLLTGLKCLRIHKSYITYGILLELPSWLDHLKNLEVFDMGWGHVQFPRLVSLKMERLRYFRAEHIDCRATKINTWNNIECLKHVSHKDWMRYTSKLTSGCHLRELGIRFDGRIERHELRKVRTSSEKMQYLVKLHLWWTGDILEIALAMPNHLTNLTKLKLSGKMPKCPATNMFPPNLSHLTLEVSHLDDDPMAELGKLPKLSLLKLQYDAYRGETMQVLYDSFPCLEDLVFKGMTFLKGIVIEEGGMPQLKHLRVRRCPFLETRNVLEHINMSTQ